MVDLLEKKALILHLTNLLDEQILTATQAANSAKESKSNETKSSAGDKFETGRAMMQKQQEMNESFLLQKKTLKAKLLQIDTKKIYKNVEFGALVETNVGKYFLSIGIGKINIDQKKYFVISTDAPIANVMLGLEKGESFDRNGVVQTIVDVF